ncbi:flavodoxin [Cellulomonas chitinilytica]|uniref:Flavodoxin n=1 Tax=Cellulomonas chitinilytica TaxID=398759 RepID=A0A919P3Q6_9CELL|nr:flavodoxin/nitric oxide synthase [Cellulomonas chitinilytica]GIG21343.1 flavodoxin [Cellulomonas chitinilytica]
MTALVVYESSFGNTAELARAVWAGMFARRPDVELVEVRGAPEHLPDDIDLLVVGAPTHAFGLSRPRTRADAAVQAGRPPEPSTIGVREWLAHLDRPGRTVHAAAFDTRIQSPHVPGSAASGAGKRLRHAGYAVDDVESFWVTGTKGPLAVGELERARAWGSHLTEVVPPSA